MIKWFLIVSVFGLLLGFLLTNSYEIGLCHFDSATTSRDVSCHLFYERVGDPIFYGSGALAIVFLTLLFVPQAFNAWKKFAIWFVPFAVFLFIFYPEPGSGDYFSPYPEQVFQWVSALYVVISLAIIGWAVRNQNR